ncbi:MAG: guanylate kinase [Planctomycetota bacterium]
MLVVVSGPSGVGKTTVMNGILEIPGHARAVTATTRAPREGEVDGVDYVFLAEEEFRARIGRGEFLEHAVVHGKLYGTPRSHVDEILDRGEVCLLSVDVKGAETVRGTAKAALFVFLLPPDREELERRLRSRSSDDEDEVAARLVTASQELARQDEYDVRIVNDDVDRAVSELRSAIEDYRNYVRGAL